MPKSIQFNTDMVRAILAGRKTQTRRMLNPQPLTDETVAATRNGVTIASLRDSENAVRYIQRPYTVGDIVYVRESYRLLDSYNRLTPLEAVRKYRRVMRGTMPCWYEANQHEGCELWGRLRPSIQMPEALARIWLRITNVRVERLQDISEADAIAEGIYRIDFGDGTFSGYKSKQGGQEEDTPVIAFAALWQSINGYDSWAANPWLWVYDFEVTGKPTNI